MQTDNGQSDRTPNTSLEEAVVVAKLGGTIFVTSENIVATLAVLNHNKIIEFTPGDRSVKIKGSLVIKPLTDFTLNVNGYPYRLETNTVIILNNPEQ